MAPATMAYPDRVARAIMASPSPIRHMPKSTKATFVPKSMLATYELIINLTDAFCREHLNEDYRLLARCMTAALCHASVRAHLRQGSPVPGRAGLSMCSAKLTS